MYIQITTRCNMKCAHCCYACTEKGVDMSERVFQKAIDVCEDNGDLVSIGGGEPTIHPKFWQFIGYAIGKCENVWLATNGKNTNTALTLAKMAKGVLGVDLSQDRWHERIDFRVVEAFRKEPSAYGSSGNNDMRGVRNVGIGYQGLDKNPIRSGRWTTGDNDMCPCDEILCRPDGKVKQCGCIKSPIIGDIFKGFTPRKNESGEAVCYRETE